MLSRIFFCILLSSFYCCNVNADNLGEVASSLYEPIHLIIELVRTVSIICGAGLIVGGILKYFDYRRNPVAVRLSAVIFMIIFGISLVIVALIPIAGLEAKK